MITINITGFLTDFTGGRSELTLDSAPATVGEALEKLWDLHVGLRDRVVNEQGELPSTSTSFWTTRIFGASSC